MNYGRWDMDGNMKYIHWLYLFYDRMVYICGGIIIGMLIYKFLAKVFVMDSQLNDSVFVASTAIVILLFICGLIANVLQKGIDEKCNCSDTDHKD